MTVPVLKASTLALLSEYSLHSQLKSSQLTQTALLESLLASDLTRLFAYLTAGHASNLHTATRKAAAKLLCQLTHQNATVQEKLCEVFKFTPTAGKVCINKVPPCIKGLLKTDLTALEEIRRTEDPECLYWSYPRFKAAGSTDEPGDDFPDPSCHLIGFVVADKQPLQCTGNRLTQQERGSRARQREGRPSSSSSPSSLTSCKQTGRSRHLTSTQLTIPVLQSQQPTPSNMKHCVQTASLSKPRYSIKPRLSQISPRPKLVSSELCSTSGVLSKSVQIAPKTLQSIEHSIRRIRESLTNRPNSQKENSPMRPITARGRLQ